MDTSFEARDYDIGRHERCDVRLASELAARRHCALKWDPNCQSHLLVVFGIQGCLLNGEPLRPGSEDRCLRDGDQLDFFGHKIRYVAPR